MKQKVAIGFPDGGSVSGAFALSLVKLFKYEIENPIEEYELLQPLRQSSLYIQNNRNELVLDAQFLKADWLFQIDGDHNFEPDLLRRLMKVGSLEKPIVVGLYSNISKAVGGSVVVVDCIYREVENGQYQTVSPPDNMQPFQVDAAGTGIFLTHMSVYDKVQFPWFWVELFQDPSKDRPQPMNEDIAFCRAARSAGLPIWCDPSSEAEHLKTIPLLPSTMRKFLETAWATKEGMSNQG